MRVRAFKTKLKNQSGFNLQHIGHRQFIYITGHRQEAVEIIINKDELILDMGEKSETLGKCI